MIIIITAIAVVAVLPCLLSARFHNEMVAEKIKDL